MCVANINRNKKITCCPLKTLISFLKIFGLFFLGQVKFNSSLLGVKRGFKEFGDTPKLFGGKGIVKMALGIADILPSTKFVKPAVVRAQLF